MAATKKGKKGRKYGRKKDRSPSHKRYVASAKWEVNKGRRIAKDKGIGTGDKTGHQLRMIYKEHLAEQAKIGA